MHVTINQLKEWEACEDGFERFMEGAGKDAKPDENVSLYDALDKGCEIGDITWAIGNIETSADQDRDLRLFACACARRVLPIFEKEFPEDKRPQEAIEAAEKFAKGEISPEELAAVRVAAWAAAWSAEDAAAWDAAWAAWAAWSAAGGAAWDAVRDAVWTAVRAAVWNADWAAMAAEGQAQKELLLKLLSKYK